MSIGVTQLIILIIIGILLFGNLPKIIKDLGSGISALKKESASGQRQDLDKTTSEPDAMEGKSNKALLDEDKPLSKATREQDLGSETRSKKA